MFILLENRAYYASVRRYVRRFPEIPFAGSSPDLGPAHQDFVH